MQQVLLRGRTQPTVQLLLCAKTGARLCTQFQPFLRNALSCLRLRMLLKIVKGLIVTQNGAKKVWSQKALVGCAYGGAKQVEMLSRLSERVDARAAAPRPRGGVGGAVSLRSFP